jgi:hypothetical protein
VARPQAQTGGRRQAAGGIRALMVPLGQLGHEQKRQLGCLASASLHHSSLALSLSESNTGNPDNRGLWRLRMKRRRSEAVGR